MPDLERIAGLFRNPFHQVAFFAADPESCVFSMQALGYQRWIYDEAKLIGELYGTPVEIDARMFFSYDFGPKELEYVAYNGPNHHLMNGRDGKEPVLSHLSVYLEPEEDLSVIEREMGQGGFHVIHRFETSEHRNPYVVSRKLSFREAIFDTRSVLGFDLKVIRKVYS